MHQPIDISENNETKVMHRITFKALNTVRRFTSVAMTTVTYQNGRILH